MAKYHVMPLPDTVSPGYSWQVKKENVGRKSHHRHKDAALKSARKYASSGDKIRITNSRGQTQRWVTKR